MDFRKSVLILLSTFIAATAHAGSTAEISDFTQRPEVQQFARDLSVREKLDEEEILGALSEARHLPAVIKAILPPATPATKSWFRYRARYLDRVRISNGAAFWQAHADALARAEKTYGVPAEIIVAILGVETIYGRTTGGFQTLSALATLAFDYPPRAELFRTELGALFLLARDQNRPVGAIKGSYAGAIGLPQFLPSSVRSFAVDFDGDGKVDIETNATDAIGSVGNFLAQHGWEAGGPVARPAQVTDAQGAVAAIEGGIQPRFLPEELERLGIRADPPTSIAAPAALIDLASAEAPTEYWLGYNNFYVITRYNRSSFYAMSVYQLAAAIKAERNRP